MIDLQWFIKDEAPIVSVTTSVEKHLFLVGIVTFHDWKVFGESIEFRAELNITTKDSKGDSSFRRR